MSAAEDFRRSSRAVLEAARPGSPPLEVAGSGPLADLLREQAGVMATTGERPRTVIDVTGDPEQLERLLGSVEDLGTVILAGPPPPAGAAIDLYADVHVRGLTVIGVPTGIEARG